MLSKSVVRVVIFKIVKTNTQDSIWIAEEVMSKRVDCVGFGLQPLLSACLHDPSSACKGEALKHYF